MAKKSKELLSVVVPVYNEQDGLLIFHNSLIKVLKKLPLDYEIIYVDDGSQDSSDKVINRLKKNDANIRSIHFSRNFGKEMATTAGLHIAKGEAAIMLDADGQHPVELIPNFVEKWQKGADVVIGVRTSNQSEGMVKKSGSKLFYYILRRLGVKGVIKGSTDFRLVDQVVLEEFKGLNEHNRVTRTLVDWLGYKKELLHFSANAREHGQASYSVKKLTSLALSGFVSLSFAPLYLAGYLGSAITIISLLTGIFFVVEKYVMQDPLHLNITGTAILAVLLIFLVGIILICQGLLSIYIARIYTETQNRPLYIIKRSRR